MAGFTFRKEKGVHVEDELWGALNRAQAHQLHGDIQSVRCLPDGKFEIHSKKLGKITRGGIELTHLIRRDEESEPERRAAFNASQKLARTRKSRPDLVAFAESVVADYDKSSAESPDLLPPLTEQARTEALLEVIAEAEEAEAKALESVKAKPRKGFSVRY